MSQVFSYRNTDKTPTKVVNVWPRIKREMEEAAARKRIAIEPPPPIAITKPTLFQIANAKADMKRLTAMQVKLISLAMKAEKDLRRANETMAKAKAMTYKTTINLHSYRRIEARFLKVFGFTRSQLLSKRRDQEIVMCRHCIVYWTVRLTSLSLPQIGRLMDRDHTSIIHGARKWPIIRELVTHRNLRKIK